MKKESEVINEVINVINDDCEYYISDKNGCVILNNHEDEFISKYGINTLSFPLYCTYTNSKEKRRSCDLKLEKK